MRRIGSQAALGASPMGRRALICALASALAGCGRTRAMTDPRTPPLDVALLNQALGALEPGVRPGRLGVGLLNLESAEDWTLNGLAPFPLAGAGRLLIAASALAEADARRLSLDERILLEEETLSPPWSPIADAFPARRDYTAGELLAHAVRDADNTAADVLMKRIGGPGAVTAWLQGVRLPDIRIDRYAREIEVEKAGLDSFRAAWKGETAFAAMRDRVPSGQRRRALAAYLADPRDTATPRALLGFLQALREGRLISRAATGRLLALMRSAPAAGGLAASLPPGAQLAHAAGASRPDLGVLPAADDLGLVTLADGRAYAVAVMVAGAPLSSPAARDLIARSGRVMLRAVG